MARAKCAKDRAGGSGSPEQVHVPRRNTFPLALIGRMVGPNVVILKRLRDSEGLNQVTVSRSALYPSPLHSSHLWVWPLPPSARNKCAEGSKAKACSPLPPLELLLYLPLYYYVKNKTHNTICYHDK